MKNQKGFTLIELFIALFVIGMFCFIVFLVVAAIMGSGNSNMTVGLTGFTETRCISGYTFVTGSDSRPVQVLNEHGKGVPCK